jgi:hypothetical protein
VILSVVSKIHVVRVSAGLRFIHARTALRRMTMRRRIHVHLTAAERKSYFNWSAGVLMLIAFVAIGAIVLPALTGGPAHRPVLAQQQR